MYRRRLLRIVGSASVGATVGCTGRPASRKQFVTSSPAFDSGDRLPTQFTCDGAGESPPLTIERVPDAVEALAVTAEWDLGVINEPRFWTIWNLPPDVGRIPAGVPRTASVDSLGGARQGGRPGGAVGYKPPCPPRGQPYEHRFQIYGLDRTLNAQAGISHEDAAEAIGNAQLASNRLTVTYSRPVTEG